MKISLTYSCPSCGNSCTENDAVGWGSLTWLICPVCNEEFDNSKSPPKLVAERKVINAQNNPSYQKTRYK